MKKFISLLLSASLAAGLLAGCGSSSASTAASGSTAAAPSADTSVLYHVYNSEPYITLDPSTEYSNGIMILQNVYETLTRYNSETTELEPMLAESWSSNEDGTVWTFQLRQDVTFHDGDPMTAADVKASIERTIALGQGASYNWSSVESVETNGDYEVVFNLSYAAPLDLIASAGYASYIMDSDVTEQTTEWFNEGHDGGTGPYTIAQASGNDTVILKAYENYYRGWTEDQYQNVVVQTVGESSARRQMLETGEAQISSNFSSTDLAALREETDTLTAVEAETFTNAMAFLNSAKYPCDNEDFRKCLEYAFPYEETVEGVLDGNAAYSVGLVTAGLWGHDDTLPTYSTDMEKAAEYLAASGVDVSDLTLTVTYMSGYDEYASIMQLWQSNLKTLGINLELRSMEWDEQWNTAQATNPEDRQDILIMLWWPDYASPNSWFDSLIRSEDSVVYNLAYINEPELDEMIEQAALLTATDREAAEELYVEVQRQLIEKAYLVQMYDQSHTYIISNDITVSGVIENPAYATAVQYYNVTRNS